MMAFICGKGMHISTCPSRRYIWWTHWLDSHQSCHQQFQSNFRSHKSHIFYVWVLKSNGCFVSYCKKSSFPFLSPHSRAIMRNVCNAHAPESDLYPNDTKQRALVMTELWMQISAVSTIKSSASVYVLPPGPAELLSTYGIHGMIAADAGRTQARKSLSV